MKGEALRIGKQKVRRHRKSEGRIRSPHQFRPSGSTL